MNGTILIYGATGYTGKLIAKAATDAGARPILAGRNLAKVDAVARPLGLKSRAFDLGNPKRLDAAIKDVSVVLCVAGPFSATAVGELDQAKLPHLLELKYRAVSDAAAQLGGVAQICDAFIGFQRHLY